MGIPAGAKGISAAIRQPDTVTWDPNRGQVRSKVWTSISAAAIDALAAEARFWKQPYRIRSTGTSHTIEIQAVESAEGDPNEVMPVDRWEMPANELQKSIWEHNRLLGIDAAMLNAAKRGVDEGLTLDELAENPVFGSVTAEEWDEIAEAFEHAQRQQDHFPVSQYVLRHVTNAPAAYDANIAEVNVERLYTTKQLIAEVTNPVLWENPLPGRLKWKIEHIQAPPERAGFLWSWRKLASAESTAANGRIEISTEYWLEQWSIWLYDLAT